MSTLYYGTIAGVRPKKLIISPPSVSEPEDSTQDSVIDMVRLVYMTLLQCVISIQIARCNYMSQIQNSLLVLFMSALPSIDGSDS